LKVLKHGIVPYGEMVKIAPLLSKDLHPFFTIRIGLGSRKISEFQSLG
jgi:hypothetical protein